MEPRPSRPSRPSQPYISTGATPGPPAGTPAYGQGGGLGAFGGPGPFDASSAPPAAPPLIGYDPSYSPGQPLTPLDGGRGSRILAPLLAVAALAVIVAAVAWGISRARGGDDDGQAAANLDSPVAATATTEAGAGDDPAPTAADPAAGGAATAAPTQAPEAGAAESTLTAAQQEGTRRAGNEAEVVDTPTPRASKERDDARSWLPLTEEVGEGYVRTDNGRRDLADVVGAFPDAADAEAQLAAFGWLENVYRQFELPDADSGDTNVYIISVHRFETAQGAKDALPYFQDGARTELVDDATGLPRTGDQIRALEGATGDGARQFVVYVRVDTILIRLAGTSAEGDPREDVLALVDRILAE